MSIKSIVFAASTLVLSTSANAATVTITDNLADNTFISSGSTISGLFDISAILVGNEIISASYSVNAVDDNDVTFSHQVYGAYYFQGGTLYERRRDRFYTDMVESSVVSFEGALQSTTSTASYSVINNRGSSFDYTDTHCHRYIFGGCVDHHTHHQYTRTYDNTSGYNGSLNSAGVLGLAEINAASLDGLFNFEITAASGDFTLSSVTLTLETSPVPIPAAAWLFGSGLIGLIGLARRKKV